MECLEKNHTVVKISVVLYSKMVCQILRLKLYKVLKLHPRIVAKTIKKKKENAQGLPSQ